jgi:hypothetical protein
MKSILHITSLAGSLALVLFTGCAGPAVRHEARVERRDDRQDYRVDRRYDRRERVDQRVGY